MRETGNFFGTEVTEAMGDGGQPVYIHSSGAIRLAQENAARLGHCYVGSEHLLLGLACQEYSLAASLLRRRERTPLAAGGRWPDGGHRGAWPHPAPGLDAPVLPGHPPGGGGVLSGWAVRRWGRSTCCWGCFWSRTAPGPACWGL